MEEPGKAFDVSTPEGRRQAEWTFEQNGWVTGPLWLYWKFGKVILKTVRSVLLEANAKEIEAQRQAAIEIIRAGKEHAVDELEITMSQQAVIGFAAPIERAPIELNAGPAGRMTLKVKYKDQSRE